MSFWNAERVETLKKLFADNLSSADIAAAMRASSRNVIIGKLTRLGLTDDKRPGGGMRKQAKPAYQRNGHNLRRAQKVARQIAEKPEPVKISAATPPNMRRVSILDLTNDSCRYIIGEPRGEYTYCGALEADLAGGRPYCPHHHARCFMGAPSRAPSVPGSITPSTKTFAAFDKAGVR